MPTVNKVTEVLFDQIKTELDFVDPNTAAIKNRLSEKTILMIKGSADFAEYEAQKRAQHPMSKLPSIRIMMGEMNAKLDQVLALSKENRLL